MSRPVCPTGLCELCDERRGGVVREVDAHLEDARKHAADARNSWGGLGAAYALADAIESLAAAMRELAADVAMTTAVAQGEEPL